MKRYYFRVHPEYPEDQTDFPTIFQVDALTLYEAMGSAEKLGQDPRHLEPLGVWPEDVDPVAARGRQCRLCGLAGERLVMLWPHLGGGLCIECAEKQVKKERRQAAEIQAAVGDFLFANDCLKDGQCWEVNKDSLLALLELAAERFAAKPAPTDG